MIATDRDLRGDEFGVCANMDQYLYLHENVRAKVAGDMALPTESVLHIAL